MALHAVATHFKYGIQRPPWQRHELSSVISLSFLDAYGYYIVVNAAFLFFETSKLWALIMYIYR